MLPIILGILVDSNGRGTSNGSHELLIIIPDTAASAFAILLLFPIGLGRPKKFEKIEMQ